MAVKPIPEGYHTVTPYLVVKNAARLIDFLKQAFDAEEISRMAMPDGRIKNAEIKIGDSMVMMGETADESRVMPSMLYLYVEDTDTVYEQAMKAGAISILAPTDQFYGDRNAGVKDPCGNQWWIGTRIENLTQEELEKRAAELAR